MTERLLTPSKITAWLDCAHYLTLRHEVESGLRAAPSQGFGAFAQLLVDKGRLHESTALDLCSDLGLSVLEVDGKRHGESFADWCARTASALDGAEDVIYQLPLAHDGIRGVADFVLRVTDAEGAVRFEPVDAKLARVEAKPGHVLQLCFYAEALEALTGARPERLHIWLGSGRLETIETAEVMPYWNRLRRQLATLLAEGSPAPATRPEPNPHCEFCEFAGTCDGQWRSEDSLVFVTDVTGRDRHTLEASGIATMVDLAAAGTDSDEVEGAGERDDLGGRLPRLVEQARIQVAARAAGAGHHAESERGVGAAAPARPPFRLIPRSADQVWDRGLEQLPEPDDGDVFLDFEGHPFWRADTGLFFLFGYLARDDSGDWGYHTIWAHDLDEEKAATGELIRLLHERRERHPGMHVYHYNHTERSALERLAATHGEGEAALGVLVATGLFVDLLPVVRHSMWVGTEGRSLKVIEALTGFERSHDIDRGAGAVVEFEAYIADGDTARLDRIARYNEDDVQATMALRDWLVAQRPAGLGWRAAVVEDDRPKPELDELVGRLSTFDPGTAEHTLSQLLGYWVRERRAHKTPLLAGLAASLPTLLDDPEVIGGLEPVGQVNLLTPTGRKAKWPGMRFRFPPQELGADVVRPGKSLIYGTVGEPAGYCTVDSVDIEAGEMVVVWNERSQEQPIPTAVALDDWVRPAPKPDALAALAEQVLDPAAEPNPATMALLRRDLPRFDGQGPSGGQFTTELADMRSWVRRLDRTCVAVQGPPGTGKTFRGAHMVHSLVTAGKRVGITAMSHAAIENLLTEVVEAFREAGDLDQLAGVCHVRDTEGMALDGIEFVKGNTPRTSGNVNVVAGTPWLFAGKHMRAAPVDVLIVDEAGQLALADAVAASISAHNLVLLGDPLQLGQVSQAAHPGSGGRSVLEHVLGSDATMPADRGVFLDQTRRMHPDVCGYISERIYEGRLGSHPDCSKQRTTVGTGLRWLTATHEGCSTESEQEADLIAEEISRLVGTRWTNAEGDEPNLAVGDFMVVAPYNDQVRLIRERLDADEHTRGVPVGTVDKFQGREAPVVFYSMTASSSEDIPRGSGFLFSPNRLNVAVSRARCLAYLVCTDRLLDSRARDVDEMRLIANLCAFVEHTESREGRESA
jgi:uncharacterized protein